MTTAHPSSSLAVPTSRSVLVGVLAVTTLSITGAALSVASGLSPTLGEAMGPTGRLSIPWPMMTAQVLAAAAAGSRRRPAALAGSGFVAASLLLGVVSGFFDGGYADDRLTTWERLYQYGFIASLTVVGVVAARRFRAVLASR